MLLNAVLLLGGMTLLWLLSLALRNASDRRYLLGPGFILVAGASLLWNRPGTSRPWVMSGLTLLWGVRLAGYVAWRNHGQGEDRATPRCARHMATVFGGGVSFRCSGCKPRSLWVIALPLQAVIADRANRLANRSILWGSRYGYWVLALKTIGDAQLDELQSGPSKQGPRHGPRPLALHAASQLLWRVLPLVGNLLLGRGWRCMVDDRESRHLDDLPAQVLGVGASWNRRLSNDVRSTPRISGGTSAFVPWLPRRS